MKNGSINQKDTTSGQHCLHVPQLHGIEGGYAELIERYKHETMSARKLFSIDVHDWLGQLAR